MSHEREVIVQLKGEIADSQRHIEEAMASITELEKTKVESKDTISQLQAEVEQVSAQLTQERQEKQELSDKVSFYVPTIMVPNFDECSSV